MARIGKQEHARILGMVDVEHRKVAEVAAVYGCTPANIYALLGKLRREASCSLGTAGANKDAAEKASPHSEERLFPDKALPAGMAVGPDLLLPIQELSRCPLSKRRMAGCRARRSRRR